MFETLAIFRPQELAQQNRPPAWHLGVKEAVKQRFSMYNIAKGKLVCINIMTSSDGNIF